MKKIINFILADGGIQVPVNNLPVIPNVGDMFIIKYDDFGIGNYNEDWACDNDYYVQFICYTVTKDILKIDIFITNDPKN